MTRVASFWRSNAVTIGIVIIVIAFGTILFFQAEATSKLQEQTKQQTEIIDQIHAVTSQLSKSSQQRTQQIATLTAHIDCIVTFFSQPQEERTQTAIDDISTCTLKNSSTGITNTTGSAPTAPTSVEATPQASMTPGAPVSSAPQSATPSGGSSQPSFFQREIVNPIKSIINAL